MITELKLRIKWLLILTATILKKRKVRNSRKLDDPRGQISTEKPKEIVKQIRKWT